MRRIGIDARFLGTETGIGRYILELISHLEKIDTENEYFIFLTDENWDRYEPANTNFKKVKANFCWYSWQEQFYLPRLIKRHEIDLMHIPHFNVPLFCKVPFVVTIHDLILLHYPSIRASTLGHVRYYLKYIFYRLILKHAIKNSKAILVPSNFTKKDILENFKIPKDKVTVTYEATSLDEVEPAKKDFLPRLKITRPYFLTVGNAYPHKNLERLFRVFKKFNSKQPPHSPPISRSETGGVRGGEKKFQLVFVGPDNYFYKRLRNYAKEINLSQRDIIMPGRVTDSELKLLYLNAFAHIFPSLYEGFGLPGLEAMASDTPVIAADRACLPEVYKDAAFYFNPESDEEMLDALTRFTNDEKLRQRLVERGREVIKEYDWAETARKTLEVYLSTMKK